MDDPMQYIENFFQGNLTEEEVTKFEERILNDQAFAADVAFYLSAKQSAKELLEEEKKKRYKELFTSTNGYHKKESTGKVRTLRYAAYTALAAAILTAVFVTVFNFNNPSSPAMANAYLNKNYHELSLKMGPKDDIENGIELYNGGQYAKALSQFENILQKDSLSFDITQDAGLAALQAHNYEKALSYFKRLENFRSQFSNPAVLLQAIVFMKRNQKGDKEQAKGLLERVKNEKLDGNEIAEEWLKNL